MCERKEAEVGGHGEELVRRMVRATIITITRVCKGATIPKYAIKNMLVPGDFNEWFEAFMKFTSLIDDNNRQSVDESQ